MLNKTIKRSAAVLLAVLMLLASLTAAFAVSAEAGTQPGTTQTQETDNTAAAPQAGTMEGLLASLKTFLDAFMKMAKPMLVNLTNAFQKLFANGVAQPGDTQTQPSTEPTTDPAQTNPQTNPQTGIQSSDLKTMLDGVIASIKDFLQSMSNSQAAQPAQPAA